MKKAIELLEQALVAMDEMANLMAGAVEDVEKAFALLEDLAKEAECEESD
jgi:hypothetical protein